MSLNQNSNIAPKECVFTCPMARKNQHISAGHFYLGNIYDKIVHKMQ